MIAVKCSMHMGKRLSRAHNLRQYETEKWNKDGHIDSTRSPLNRVLIDTPIEQFFDDVFGDALVEFNEKNYKKHPERLIGFKSSREYEKYSSKERRNKAVKAYMNDQKRNVQEGIFQLGDHAEYEHLVKQIGQEKADQIHLAYLTELYYKFVKDNPSLRVISAVIHMDETRDGTPHLHLDFLPVAEGSRGLTTKVSMDGALRQLGYSRKTKAKDGENSKHSERPYIKWLNNARLSLEDFAQSFCNERKLGITILPSEKAVARHEQPEDWKARQGRVKATQGKVAALFGKDKKARMDAAEYIISNAQTVAESITKNAKATQKKVNEELEEAKQLSGSARVDADSAEAYRKKAIAEAKEYKNKNQKLNETVQQAVVFATAERDRKIKELEEENAHLKAKIQKDAYLTTTVDRRDYHG